jgi:hypothetical protein
MSGALVSPPYASSWCCGEEQGNFRFPSFIKVMCVHFLEDVALLSTEPHILPHLILFEAR